VTGQVVEAGEVFELGFVLFAVGDQAHHTEHPRRRAGRRHLDRATVVDPVELAAFAANTVFAVVAPHAGEMLLQGQQPLRQILRVDPPVEDFAGHRHVRREASEKAAGGAGPVELVGRQIPVVEHVSGGLDGRLEACQFGRHLIVHGRPLHGRDSPT
jgi:hypothetical protein